MKHPKLNCAFSISLPCVCVCVREIQSGTLQFEAKRNFALKVLSYSLDRK